jgi:hypothetical protein
VQLSTYEKDRVRYQLGYMVTAVPAGDLARLEEAMNNIPSTTWYGKIIEQLRRCETAERKTEVASTPSTRLEKIEGDVDRTVSSANAKESLKVWDEIYIYETNRLAGILYVANYKDPYQSRYLFERSGAEFIQAIPGPADVAVGTRLLLHREWQ